MRLTECPLEPQRKSLAWPRRGHCGSQFRDRDHKELGHLELRRLQGRCLGVGPDDNRCDGEAGSSVEVVEQPNDVLRADSQSQLFLEFAHCALCRALALVQPAAWQGHLASVSAAVGSY